VTKVVHRSRSRFDVYIGRPSKWGNPFSHKPGTLALYRVASREEAIARYREWLLAQPELVAQVKSELKGKVLGCWCSPLPCHGDVLRELADAEDQECTRTRHARYGILDEDIHGEDQD